MNLHLRMGVLPLKKRVNRDKCSFATKQCMFGVFAIDEILRYRGTRFPGSRTLCHPAGSHLAPAPKVVTGLGSTCSAQCPTSFILPCFCSEVRLAPSRKGLQGVRNTQGLLLRRFHCVKGCTPVQVQARPKLFLEKSSKAGLGDLDFVY